MDANEFSIKIGYGPVHFLGEWNDYNVWEPDSYIGDIPQYIGVPFVILEKENELRVSNIDESYEIANFFDDSPTPDNSEWDEENNRPL